VNSPQVTISAAKCEKLKPRCLRGEGQEVRQWVRIIIAFASLALRRNYLPYEVCPHGSQHLVFGWISVQEWRFSAPGLSVNIFQENFEMNSQLSNTWSGLQLCGQTWRRIGKSQAEAQGAQVTLRTQRMSSFAVGPSGHSCPPPFITIVLCRKKVYRQTMTTCSAIPP